MGLPEQVCAFYLDTLFCGLDVLEVREVVAAMPTTTVPRASGEVAGLINLRGQILTSLDLRRRLGLPERPPQISPLHVVVSRGDGAISLLVDRMAGVSRVDSEQFEAPPAALGGPAAEVIRGAVKLEDTLLLVLDLDRLVDVNRGATGGAG